MLKAAIRLMILCGLAVGAAVLSNPDTVSAATTCPRDQCAATCQSNFNSCLKRCTTNACDQACGNSYAHCIDFCGTLPFCRP